MWGYQRLAQLLMLPVSIHSSEGCGDDMLFLSDSPVFISKPGDMSGDSGQEVVLSCRAVGNPPPSYTWSHRDKVILHPGLASPYEEFKCAFQ